MITKWLISKMIDLFEILISDMENKKEYDKILLNLLAVLHRDGGDYTYEVGITKSVIKAISNFNESKKN